MPKNTEVETPEVADATTAATVADATTAAPVADVVEATPAPAKAAVATADVVTETRKNRKTREGMVVSDKMDKTAVVAVIERVRHAKYGKFMMRTKRLYAHDETNDAHTGDRVRVMETRPLSKNKRWRVVEVLERAK
jgi:small subunit ribosomal protein S17